MAKNVGAPPPADLEVRRFREVGKLELSDLNHFSKINFPRGMAQEVDCGFD